MTLARALSTVSDLWERSRGGRLPSGLLGDSPIVARGDGYPVARVAVVDHYISFLLYFHLPFPPGFFFSFSRVELCFHPLSFSLPSFLHTGCWSHHPLEQRSPLSIPPALSSFFSISIFGLRQTWETSFGTSTPALSLLLRVFIRSGPAFGVLSGASFSGISLGE